MPPKRRCRYRPKSKHGGEEEAMENAMEVKPDPYGTSQGEEEEMKSEGGGR